ncbi:MAG: hypothetical protein VW687_03705 [Curvibacter sp.]
MSRYLDIHAQGLTQWLGAAPASPAQRVYWGLLQMPASAPLVPAELAERFGLAVPEFSRALFELNRGKGLQVQTQVHDHTQEFVYDHALLCEDLRELGGPTPQLMLAGADGLCLAQQGLPEEVCSHQAAVCHAGPSPAFPCVIPLHLGERVVHLCSPQVLDTACAPLLRLVRRLLAQAQPAGLPA